ncbi:response regulator [Brevibacterium album]|uniref:response regulator n=1 Tax=Brevibacterium album TaxID=417948 RepID=UPI0003FE1244|nr:response regulator transcription factor [Brevibacterium album]
MSEAHVQVMLVDDQVLVRAGFAMVIDSQPDMTVVGQAGDGEEALAAAHELQPDVVLMDVRMPRLDGIQTTRRLLELADSGVVPAPRIIVLTTFDTDEYALAALRAGASGFLLKDAQPEVLLDSIRTVVDGGAVIAPTTTRRLLSAVFADGPAPAPAEVPTSTAPAPSRVPSPEQTALLESLTPREREVLELVARGMSNAEIVEELFLAAPTVKTHVSRILMKLGARDRVQAVVFAYEAGLVRPSG